MSTDTSVPNVVGWTCRVPLKQAYCARGWFVTVLEQRGKFILVGGNKSAGKPWWTSVDEARDLKPPKPKIERRPCRACEMLARYRLPTPCVRCQEESKP
jgi:hypothetical protein